MRMNIKLSNIRDTLLFGLIIICVVAIIGSQIYVGINTSNDTEDAVLYTCKDGLSFTGVLVRNPKRHRL